MHRIAVLVGTLLVFVPSAAAAVHIRTSAIVDGTSGAVDIAFPDLGDIAGATDSGHGVWFVTTSTGVRRVAPSGALDGSWPSQVTGPAGKIARVGARLYVIAQAGRGESRLVALSAGDGRVLWRSAPFGRRAYAIAANPSSIYVGGVGIGTGARGWIEKLDARTGRLLPWRTPPFPRYSIVATIALGNGQVYAGGGGSSPVAFAARSILAVGGGRLYLGGDLRSAAGVDNLAAIDLRTRRVITSWAPRLAKFVSVNAIVPSGRRVLVLGSFSSSIG